MEPTVTHDRMRAVDWAAVGVGAGAGLLLLVVTAIVQAVLRRHITDFDHTGWVAPLVVAVVAAYGVAGWVAERRDDFAAPLTHGALAGLGAFLLWVPLRVGIWIVRDEHRGLVRGSDPA